MSVIAGIYSRREGVQVPERMCSALTAVVSRDDRDGIRTFASDRAFIAKLDIGAWDDNGCETAADGSIAVLAGEPLIGDQGRNADLRSIAAAVKNGDPSQVLSRANGTFSFASFDTDSTGLTLGTDKLGVRPIYYAVLDHFVVFASAMRILESFADVPKKLDLRGVSEIAALGHTLGERTPYCDIKCLRAARYAEFQDSAVREKVYFNWSEVVNLGSREDKVLDGLYDVFTHAVSRRLGKDATTAAYLSGGLDSRCIVASLLDKGARVHTYNFARPRTQDQVFGRNYASSAGAVHHEVPKRSGDEVPDFSRLMADAWNADADGAEHRHLVWSGEGGSVAVGHVPFRRPIVDHVIAGREADAVDEFLDGLQIRLPRKLFRGGLAAELESLIREGMLDELAAVEHPEPARRFYLFMMLNNQRRKLAGHFEDIDLHRLELQLPFFDAAVIRYLCSIPIEACLGHRLYVKWLTRFPASTTAVPWQAYPGGEPCPLPVPTDLSYQWDDTHRAHERATIRQAVFRQATRLVRARDFPGKIMDRANIAAVAVAHGLGVRDYGYFVESAEVYYKYWTRSNREFSY